MRVLVRVKAHEVKEGVVTRMGIVEVLMVTETDDAPLGFQVPFDVAVGQEFHCIGELVPVPPREG